MHRYSAKSNLWSTVFICSTYCCHASIFSWNALAKLVLVWNVKDPWQLPGIYRTTLTYCDSGPRKLQQRTAHHTMTPMVLKRQWHFSTTVLDYQKQHGHRAGPADCTWLEWHKWCFNPPSLSSQESIKRYCHTQRLMEFIMCKRFLDSHFLSPLRQTCLCWGWWRGNWESCTFHWWMLPLTLPLEDRQKTQMQPVPCRRLHLRLAQALWHLHWLDHSHSLHFLIPYFSLQRNIFFPLRPGMCVDFLLITAASATIYN